MKKIVLGFIIIIVSFTILIFYYGLKTKKVYDTEGLVGKPILKIDLELLNSEKDHSFSPKLKLNEVRRS